MSARAASRRRPAASTTSSALAPGSAGQLRPVSALVLDEAEAERALDWVGFEELDLDGVAEAEGLAGALADQGMVALVEGEKVVAEGGDGDQALGTGLVEADEEAEGGGAGDAAVEAGVELGSHEAGDQALEGAALGFHGPALAAGEVLAQARQLGLVHTLGKPVLAKDQVADEGAVDDEVAVAADGRGEMGVVLQVEAEMADVLRAVDGLGLGAQDQGGDQLTQADVGDALEEAGEVAGLSGGAAPGDAQALQELGQGFEAGGVRAVVDAVEASLLGRRRAGGRPRRWPRS